MSDLVLYHAAPSRSMVAHWMLEELGVPYRIELLDLDAKDQKRPEYLAINPMGRVPALRHGDVVVTETAAICAYLAEAFPDAGLDVPVGSPERGPYLRWLFFAPVTMEPAILWQTLDLPGDMEYRPFADLAEVADVLRDAVRGREFIVGGRFTAADVMVGSSIMWGTQLMPVLPRHPELLEYWARLEQRPAWQRSFGEDQKIMQARQAGGGA
ncbi:MAG: glutathione S-transferase [Pseudomonadales bacterium]